MNYPTQPIMVYYWQQFRFGDYVLWYMRSYEVVPYVRIFV
jgi:hypothetical protein